MRRSSLRRFPGCSIRSRSRTPRSRARSTPPARPRSAAGSAPSAPSRTCRWRVLPGGSCPLRNQIDENILQRTLGGLQVAEADVGGGEIAQPRRDPGALAAHIVGSDEFAALPRTLPPLGL